MGCLDRSLTGGCDGDHPGERISLIVLSLIADCSRQPKIVSSVKCLGTPFHHSIWRENEGAGSTTRVHHRDLGDSIRNF